MIINQLEFLMRNVYMNAFSKIQTVQVKANFFPLNTKIFEKTA